MTLRDTDSTYSFINEFGYMGGGVGIGDFNNDGLKDIYFSGNQVSSGLYINKGEHKFEDVTKKAGVETNVWATGISIVDINNDGYDDIYVCVFGKDLKKRAKNLLFINQHDLTFRESAVEYGLADTSYSTQAAFFDYDKDGDLDMYLANYLLADRNANTIYPRDRSGFSTANDRLYRNEGDSANRGHPWFKDVTIAAGIKEDGYGLGLSVSDLNNDGWPDVYVANDFLSNDNLWLNNRNGTFTNCISSSLQHQSYSSMGSEAADINKTDCQISLPSI
ncbi:MAG: VCBS repeat-containing protein [Chitinophagaceae bacterium]